MSAAPHPIPFERQKPHVYRLWNHRVESDFDLGELDEDDTAVWAHSIIRVLRAKGPAWPHPNEGVIENQEEDGNIWHESWEVLGGYISHFPGMCSFRIFPSAMRIEYAPERDLDSTTLAHLTLDHAIPRLFSLQPGCIVLHASAIAMDDGVVAVLGASGRGKSTLAAWLGAHGHRVLTDDCLLLQQNELSGEWQATPSYHSVRLWPDSMNALGIDKSATREFIGFCSKRRTTANANLSFTQGGTRLTECFTLDNPTESDLPVVRPLDVNRAFLALAQSVFRLAVVDPQVNRREFEALTELAATVRFWSLSYQREYKWLPAVEKAIVQTLQTDSQEIEGRKLPQ